MSERLPAAWLETLDLPLIAAPMFLVSSIDLVAAACENGVIGAIPTVNARSPEILDGWLAELTARLEKAKERKPAPWAINLIVHRTNRRLQADLDLCVKYRAPLIITALGSPREVVPAVHDYGGLVFADVSTPEYAYKAAQSGADGLVLVCSGAGGHTGQIAAPAFISAVREFWDGIIVVAGAMTSGNDLRAAQLLGADLAYMGTRFIATEESMAAQAYKQMVVDCAFKDIVCTDVITGAFANNLRPSMEAAGIDCDRLDELKTSRGFDLEHGKDQPKAWKDIWSAGHAVGQIRKVESTAAIVGQLREEYRSALAAEFADPWVQRYAAEARKASA
ncbi:MAG: nitronate monooxygenase [Rhodovibrionaceae bacterium]